MKLPKLRPLRLAPAILLVLSFFIMAELQAATITTTVDESLNIVTYSITDIDLSTDLDFHIDTAFDQAGLETDQTKLQIVDANLSGVNLFRSGLTSPRWGFFSATPQGSPAIGEFTGLFAIEGTDESNSKPNPYLFGIVYTDQYTFTGNFLTSTLQINSVDYQFDIPELIVNAVPIPSSIWLLVSGFFVLFHSRVRA